MMHCYAEGSLRAYLDDALPADERGALAGHLAGCPACRSRLEEQRALAAQVGALLVAAPPDPDPHAALARLRASSNNEGAASVAERPAIPFSPGFTTSEALLRRNSMSRLTRFWSSPRRPLFAGLALIIVLLGLLALPPVRAAADQLLSVFRVQQLLFVPTSSERIQQLQRLDFDENTLFIAKPKLVNKPAQPRAVSSESEVFGAVGFAFRQPAAFPSAPTSRRFVIRDRSVFQFQVDVQAARHLLALMDVNDVMLPDTLGSKPITADMPPSVEAHYQGTGYQLTLNQGRSPTVTLPDGVDLAQLGRAALRLLGMDAREAEALSRKVDWSSTLIFPFPSDLADLQVQQVSVGGGQALLMGDARDERAHWQLYWQQGDRFYMLEGRGDLSAQDMIAAAESVR